MIDTIKTLCSYTACSIHQKECKLKIESEQTFFTIAKENGLIPIIYETIDHEVISMSLNKHLKKHFYAFIAHDIQSLAYMSEIDDILNKHEIKHIFLKGSILKELYPKTYYRGMGDIDILIESHDIKKVQKIFKNHNIILESSSEVHDRYLINNQMPIEIHPKLYKDFNKKYESLFSNPWIHARKINAFRYQLDASYEIVYLLYHLAKHLDSSGVGLRSILDLGIYLNSHQDDINKVQLLNYLKKASMETFFTQMVYLNIRYFDFKNLEAFLYTDLLNDQAYDNIIEFFSKSGIHGKGTSYNHYSMRLTIRDKNNISKLRLFISILFPTYKSMASIFPVLRKIPLLLPFLWIYRLLNLLFTKTKHTFKYLTKFTSAKPNDQIKNIYNDLGL